MRNQALLVIFMLNNSEMIRFRMLYYANKLSIIKMMKMIMDLILSNI